MKVYTYAKRYFRCLACEKGEMSIEHLIDSPQKLSWGPWYCSECGMGHKGTAGEGSVDAELAGGRKEDALVLLKLDPGAGTVYLTVRSPRFLSNRTSLEGKAQYDDGDRYYYNEHTCPTNYLRNVVEILQVLPDGTSSADPHGIFEYQGTAPPYDEEVSDTDNVQARLDLFKA